MSFVVSKDLGKSHLLLSGNLSERERSRALDDMTKTKNPDAARLIFDTLQLTPLPHLKCQLVKALGSFSDSRNTEVLYRLAYQEDDVGREAVLALGRVRDPIALETLCYFITQKDFAFQREALHAIGSAEVLTIQDELLSLFPALNGPETDSRVFQTFLLVLAKHGVREIEGELVKLLEIAASSDEKIKLLDSCLLAAGGIATEAMKEILTGLDLQDKTFSQELKQTVIMHIEERLNLALDDVLKAFKQRNSSEPLSFLLSKLQNFSRSELSDALFVEKEALDEGTLLWLEIASFNYATLAHDKACLEAGFALLDKMIGGRQSFQLALFARRMRSKLGLKAWKKLLGGFDSSKLLFLGKNLTCSAVHDCILKSLKKLVAKSKHSDSDLKLMIEICNALVVQCQLSKDVKEVEKSVEILMQLASNSLLDHEARARFVRALGQVGFLARVGAPLHLQVVSLLEDLLSKKSSLSGVLKSSVLHACGNLSSVYALNVLLNYLRKSIAEEDIGSIKLALSMLCLYQQKDFEHPEVFENNLVDLNSELIAAQYFRPYILRLVGLGLRFSAKLDPLIVEALKSGRFDEIMLGLGACHVLEDSDSWHCVQNLGNSSDKTIRAMALETLCRSKNGFAQEMLSALIGPSSDISAELLLRCFEVFEVAEDMVPLKFAATLEQYCKPSGQWGPFKTLQVRECASSLADQIRFLGSGQLPGVVNTEILADVDKSLFKDLPQFGSYSETLKTVLRNSELIFCHPEIFDDHVDKSTSIIELVKSIDLLLQERVGEPLFLSSRPEVLTKLRARVARLGLQESQLDNNEVLRLIGADHIVAPELFPSIKLGRMIQSIQAGRFITEQLRILDGLKGWAVFLLLFARPYSVGGVHLEPAIVVRDLPGDSVARLAWEMIQLQERRNVAAHRGTIVDLTEIRELRRQAIRVLFTIDSLFAFAPKKQKSKPRGVA